MAKTNEYNIGFAVGLLVAALVIGVVTWLLWNWLMPRIFGLPTIHLLEAYGLLVLSNIFFKLGIRTAKHDH